jgi:WD40 repeat protein
LVSLRGDELRLLGLRGPILQVGAVVDGTVIPQWSAKLDYALGLALHQSGRVVVGTDEGIIVFDGSAERRRLLAAPVLQAVVPAISPSGRLWDADGGKGRLLAELRGHEGRVSGVAFRTDDELVTGGWDGTIRRWDLSPLHEDPAALVEATNSWHLTLEEVLAAPR